MAALLRQGARRIGGSVLQRTQAEVKSTAVVEERRRLVPRRLYSTKEAAEKGAGEDITSPIQRKKDWLGKLVAGRERFERWDAEFTKMLNGAGVIFSVYAILSSRVFLDEME